MSNSSARGGRRRVPGHQSRGRGTRQTLGQVRIIAGQWRGRKLAVPTVPGLRPSGDRVRETLFNWLQAYVAGSQCLDLFAGSGALGFEAGSRFAASVTLVEPQADAFQALEQARDQLTGDAQGDAETRPEIHLVQSTAQQFLEENQQAFDVVFVDPPFDQQLQEQIVRTLVDGHLSTGALVYVENPAVQSHSDQLPTGLSVFREKVIGAVRAQLLTVSGA